MGDGRPDNDQGWLGIPVLVILLAVAAFRVRSTRLPAAIAAFAAVTAALLLIKPVTLAKPPMAEGGMAMVAILCGTAVLGIAHVITLNVRQRPPVSDSSLA